MGGEASSQRNSVEAEVENTSKGSCSMVGLMQATGVNEAVSEG